MPSDNSEPVEDVARPTQILVWDGFVRFGHWLLVLLFFVAYFTEDDALTLHSWAGYGVLIYIFIRVVWGFVGSRHARFSDFLFAPFTAAGYMKDLLRFQARRYIGHSPAGAYMVFALLVGLALTSVSGVALLAVEENAGPLAPWLGRSAALEAPSSGLTLTPQAQASSGEESSRRQGSASAEALEEAHEVLANLTLVLVILHVAGVILASVAHRENLARAMVTGRKRST